MPEINCDQKSFNSMSHPDGTDTLCITGKVKITDDLTVVGDSIISTEEHIVQAGLAATPSITTVGDVNTGMWFPAADTIAWSTGGVERLRIADGAVTSAVPVLAPDGTVSLPSITNTGDLDTGAYFPAANTVGLAGGGVLGFQVNATGGSHAGANGEFLNVKVATESLTTDGGAGTEVSTTFIPAAAIVLGVVARVTTVIAGAGASTFALGDGTDADLYGTALAFAADTTVDHTDWTASPLTHSWSASAQALTLTADAGQFDSGVIRLTVFYIDTTAPTA
jgi:hypothetical protein